MIQLNGCDMCQLAPGGRRGHNFTGLGLVLVGPQRNAKVVDFFCSKMSVFSHHAAERLFVE
jgi:hypothetical protein